MKRFSIFVILLLSMIKGVSQESEEEYQNEEDVQNEEEVQEDEEEEGGNNYFDIYEYFNFTNDEYADALDKVNDMNQEDQNVLYKLVIEVQKDQILKDRLYGELIAKPKKKNPYRGKDSPGFICVLRGLIENQTVYNDIVKNGGSEDQARNVAALAERTVRRKCGITKKVNKE
ncbi:hypothetical protein [Aquimarina sp. 2201CG5-10]|uniref:hypothetical protein n=1 Tax=Aquimarina callyspongiae TaxID=3098150 RepID=UPI002AB3B7A4|nr:hypothetical protein [Aquimarina sp. 2201CG5-10]MDY8135251.1 hypothetical protein [Aquimarina sp. 2201CG5-10]